MNNLEFEKPIAELEEKITRLQRISRSRELNLDAEIEKQRNRNGELTREIFARLDAWQPSFSPRRLMACGKGDGQAEWSCPVCVNPLTNHTALSILRAG